jgi:hypothetical protein
MEQKKLALGIPFRTETGTAAAGRTSFNDTPTMCLGAKPIRARKRSNAEKTVNNSELNLCVMVGPGFFQPVCQVFYGLRAARIPH